ncbi:hypothetical protein AVEN_182633-1 [Araneus ventricosus]|uniref:Uncharacterized protein n=1 Tax=Araneus ventricosus TaxID=182803 RepID=A0A4Y2K8A2_ARAVE|nr:hypothetical protein AVEN_182633-1 [Araneus ventricosus]
MNTDQNENPVGLFGNVSSISDQMNLKIFQNREHISVETNDTSNQKLAPKSKYIPAVFIDDPNNVPQLLSFLSDKTKEKITFRIVGQNKLNIFSPTSAAHRIKSPCKNKITFDRLKSSRIEVKL